MKELLHGAGDDANKIATVLNVFRELSRPNEPIRKISKLKFFNFSDLVVRVLPINTEANLKHRMGLVFHEICDLCHLQANLIHRGVLVRGALTLGFVAFDKGLLFGPALARAYEIESKIAKYPRIVVDDLLITGLEEIPALRAHSFEEEMKYLEGTLRKDQDGVFFLDYLNWTMDNADDPAQHINFIKKHGSLITDQIAKVSRLDLRKKEARRKREKFLWMKQLHNDHIKNLNPDILLSETGEHKNALTLG
jgi:hypothetical protein